jgi:hypothetical protein
MQTRLLLMLLLQLVLLTQLSQHTAALRLVVAPIHAISPTFDLMGVAAELQSRCVCAISMLALQEAQLPTALPKASSLERAAILVAVAIYRKRSSPK